MAVSTRARARTWEYKAQGGLNFPVRSGESWSVGPHGVFCADVLSPLSEWTGARLIFTDPPWTEALISACYRQVGARPRSFEDIHRRLFHLAALHRATIYVECARDRLPGLVATAEQQGGRIVAAHPVRTGRDDGAVVGASFDPAAPVISHDLLVVDGARLCASVLHGAMKAGLLKEGDTVCDPMCGTGKTARLALRSGLRFVGGDLNPRCCSATLTSLAQATGERPRRG